MNRARRARLRKIRGALELMKSDVEALEAEEVAAFDNLPGSLQLASSGQRTEECVDIMADLVSSINDALELIDGTLV